MQIEQAWRQYWPVVAPTDCKPPFYVDGDNLVHIETGLTLYPFKMPDKTVEEAAPFAGELGGVLVDRWPTMWGTSVGFSCPGSECAWFLLDNFEEGKFASIGVRRIRGIFFGHKAPNRTGEYIDAARYALAYGIPRDLQEAIESELALGRAFPHKDDKLRKLWTRTDSLEHHTTEEALVILQRRDGITPFSVGAATKTIQIILED